MKGLLGRACNWKLHTSNPTYSSHFSSLGIFWVPEITPLCVQSPCVCVQNGPYSISSQWFVFHFASRAGGEFSWEITIVFPAALGP